MATIEGPRPPGMPCWNDLMSPDVKAAAAFYRRLFGWEYDASGAEFGFYHMARVDGRAAAGIGQMPEGAGFPSAWTVYFAAADAAAMSERATSLGGTVMMGPMEVPGQGHMAMVQDPTGAVFGLWQHLGHTGAGIEGVHGAMVWREVITADAAAARTFYTALLDATSRPIEGAGTPYEVLVKDGADIAGIMQAGPQMQGVPPHWMPYFEVDDVEAAAREAEAGGGRVVAPPFDTPYGRIAVLSDPFGAAFSVNHSVERG